MAGVIRRAGAFLGLWWAWLPLPSSVVGFCVALRGFFAASVVPLPFPLSALSVSGRRGLCGELCAMVRACADGVRVAWSVRRPACALAVCAPSVRACSGCALWVRLSWLVRSGAV